MISAKTGDILFHETLCRVAQTGGGFIAARQFVKSFEAQETGRSIDRNMLSRAIEFLEAHPTTTLSVNLSAYSLNDAGWNSILARELARNRDLCPRLILEITETAQLPTGSSVPDKLQSYRASGVRIAIDDFGAGTAGLQVLANTPVDILKIDGALVRGVATNSARQAIVKSVVSLCHDLNLTSIAECVETPDDAQWLRQAGLDGLQGYFVQKPMVFQASGA